MLAREPVDVHPRGGEDPSAVELHELPAAAILASASFLLLLVSTARIQRRMIHMGDSTCAVRCATSGTFRGADAQRLGKQWPRAASGGEALQDLLAPPIREPERDPAIEIDPLKHNRKRRVALRPPR